jgi:GNAT superfamily N-acetyltransferase
MEISLAKASDVPGLEPLWKALYEHQLAVGQMLPVPEGAFAEWARGMAPVLGRFGVIVMAVEDSEVQGFVAGRIRPIPSHFGGGLAGFISDVFVKPDFRGRGISRQLIYSAEKWFVERDVKRLELQVVPGNAVAIAVYEKLGWRQEFFQMARPVGK